MESARFAPDRRGSRGDRLAGEESREAKGSKEEEDAKEGEDAEEEGVPALVSDSGEDDAGEDGE